MMKAIMFDTWGTLLETGVFPSPVKEVKNILRIEEPFHVFITRFEETFMTNNFANLKEAFEAVCKAFDIPPRDFVIDKLIGMWNKNMLLAKPFPETIEVLTKLKKDYKLALLSNTDPFSIDPVLEKYELRKYFNVMAFSYELGCLKTNAKMFEHVLRKLGVKKNEAIMVGDSIQSDIEPAENAGIKAVLVDRHNRREHPNKITTLVDIEKFL
jgi:HAD superfamily hydrolase (TIGR01549 family)